MKKKITVFLDQHKDLILHVGVVLIASILLILGHKITTGEEQVFGRLGSAEVYPAKVDLILARQASPYTIDGKTMEDIEIHFYATIQSGERKGETHIVRQINNAMATIVPREVQEGSRVMIVYVPYQGETLWIFQEYNRAGVLAVLILLFFALLLLFGGKKGLNAMLSLIFTCLCIFYFFLPAILSGGNIYILTILSSLFVIAVTLILVNGLNLKSLSAAIGCVGGLLVAGALFALSDYFLKLTGLLDEDSSYLIYMNPESPLDLKAVIFASVIIGVLGAVLDVGVSIVASLNEIYGGRTDYTLVDVMNSGMNIGRDIISTMTNTLILAYIGGALSLTLLLMTYSNSLLELVNRETIVVEILQALLGSIGLLFTIPLTTFFYAMALRRGNERKPIEASGGESSEEKEPQPLKVTKPIEHAQENKLPKRNDK